MTARSSSATPRTAVCPSSASSASRISRSRASTASRPAAATCSCSCDDFAQPNGLCFSPDESLLYVNDTDRAHIRVFDVGPGHSLSNGRVLADGIGTGDMTTGELVDGMKLDERGNVYVTGPKGVWIVSAEGETLGVIEVPENVGNLNWGGDDWQTLFIPASTSIYSIRLEVGGNRLGYMH